MIDCDSLVYRHVAMNKDLEPGVVLADLFTSYLFNK